MTPTKIQVGSPDTVLPILAFSVWTVLIAVVTGVAVLNPVWSEMSPPFPILRVFPPITAPVDGPYYLQIAEEGYAWNEKQPLSLWYHPLLPALISIAPKWLSSNIWFWLLGLAFSLGSLLLTHQITVLYAGEIKIHPAFLLLTPLIPGGLGIATGNAEIPTLFFASLILLSVIKWHNWPITVVSSALAILTKPNALYMIPILSVYAIWGHKDNDRKTVIHSLIGIAIVILGWLAWIAIVDWNANEWGAYWQARDSFTRYVAGDPASYFLELAKSFVYGVDLRDKLRYSIGLIIPLVNLWVIAFAPFRNPSHRYALAAGNLAMFGLALWQGNPNKLIVYSTTLPGYFSTYILFIRDLAAQGTLANHFRQLVTSVIFWSFIVFMIVFYVLGTPLGWYY
jgi:hypothetical protein